MIIRLKLPFKNLSINVRYLVICLPFLGKVVTAKW